MSRDIEITVLESILANAMEPHQLKSGLAQAIKLLRDGAATPAMVDRFLAWPLPASVCSDPCASMPDYPHRIGTHLLNAVEARAMLEHVLGGPL